MLGLCARKGATFGCSEKQLPTSEWVLVATRNGLRNTRTADLQMRKGARLSSAVNSRAGICVSRCARTEATQASALPPQFEVLSALVTNRLLSAVGARIVCPQPVRRYTNNFKRLRNRTGETYHEDVRNEHRHLHHNRIQHTLSATSAQKHSNYRTAVAAETCSRVAGHHAATGNQDANRVGAIAHKPKVEFWLPRFDAFFPNQRSECAAPGTTRMRIRDNILK